MKNELKNELKQKTCVVRGHASKEKIEKLAIDYAIELTCKIKVKLYLDGLGAKSSNHQSIKLLVSPKYHCKLAQEGVKYIWGIATLHWKRNLKNLTLCT